MANDLQYKNDYMEPFIYLRINIFIPNRKNKEILSFFKVCRKTDYLTQRVQYRQSLNLFITLWKLDSSIGKLASISSFSSRSMILKIYKTKYLKYRFSYSLLFIVLVTCIKCFFSTE